MGRDSRHRRGLGEQPAWPFEPRAHSSRSPPRIRRMGRDSRHRRGLGGEPPAWPFEPRARALLRMSRSFNRFNAMRMTIPPMVSPDSKPVPGPSRWVCGRYRTPVGPRHRRGRPTQPLVQPSVRSTAATVLAPRAAAARCVILVLPDPGSRRTRHEPFTGTHTPEFLAHVQIPHHSADQRRCHTLE